MIKQNMIRLVLPFHMSNYQELRKSQFEALQINGWTRVPVVTGENDLYDYIIDLLDEKNENSIGATWEFDKNQITKKKYATLLDGEYVDWKIDRLGLALFDTAVGIIWFEIGTKFSFASIEQMQDFLYIIKELARNKKQNTFSLFDDLIENMGVSVEELQTDPDVEITQELKLRDGKIKVMGRRKISLYENVIAPYLKGFVIDTFFMNRKRDNQLLPDRAIPFTWVLCSPKSIEKPQAITNVLRLGRCYNKEYSISTDMDDKELYCPFDDSMWYTCLEGCSNLTYPKTDKKFYSEGYRKRLDSYFYLFLLEVGQYYSLLQLAKEVSQLKTDETMYSSRNTMLEDMLDKIHIFNLKNKYSQVGHLTQHNEYYDYVKRKLSIDVLHTELEVEVRALYEMIERKRSIKNAKRYKLISVISSLFVGVDLFGNINQLFDSFDSKHWSILHQLLFDLACMSCVVLLGVIIWVVISMVDKAICMITRRRF